MPNHTLRLLRSLRISPLQPLITYPRLTTHLRTRSTLANTAILTDDDYIPFDLPHSHNNLSPGFLGQLQSGWSPPAPVPRPAQDVEWDEPDIEVASEWGVFEAGTMEGGLEDVLELGEGRDVESGVDVHSGEVNPLHTGGGGILREGGRRPAVERKREKKRLAQQEKREAEAKMLAERAEKGEGRMEEREERAKEGGVETGGYKKRVYSKPWDPTFKKAPRDAKDGFKSYKGHKPWLDKKPWNPPPKKASLVTQDASTDQGAPESDRKRKRVKISPRAQDTSTDQVAPKLDKKERKEASPSTQDTSTNQDPLKLTHKKQLAPHDEKRKAWYQALKEAKPDTPRWYKKGEYKPWLKRRTPLRSAPKQTSSDTVATDPDAPKPKPTPRGRRRSVAFERANRTAPRLFKTPRGLATRRAHPEPRPLVLREQKPKDPNKKSNKWELPAIEEAVIEPTKLQRYVASTPLSKIERWRVEKARMQTKLGGAKWAPMRKLSPEALEGIRILHKKHPEYTTEKLSQLFSVSPEAIRRVLKSKWRADEATLEDRMERWARRGDKVWERWLDLGVVHTKKMGKDRSKRRKEIEARTRMREVVEKARKRTREVEVVEKKEEGNDNISKRVVNLSRRFL